jgi:hypothetical protein
MSEQNWIVTFKKQNYLEELQVLTTQEALPKLLTNLLKKYPEYTEQDSITIRPTSMTYLTYNV